MGSYSFPSHLLRSRITPVPFRVGQLTWDHSPAAERERLAVECLTNSKPAGVSDAHKHEETCGFRVLTNVPSPERALFAAPPFFYQLPQHAVRRRRRRIVETPSVSGDTSSSPTQLSHSRVHPQGLCVRCPTEPCARPAPPGFIQRIEDMKYLTVVSALPVLRMTDGLKTPHDFSRIPHMGHTSRNLPQRAAGEKPSLPIRGDRSGSVARGHLSRPRVHASITAPGSALYHR